MIIDRSKKKEKRIEIDLNGPEGNAFALLGLAGRLARQCGFDAEAIQTDMQSSNYEHPLEVFDTHFGSVVVMYR